MKGLNIVCENYARIYWVQSITQLEVSGNQQLWVYERENYWKSFFLLLDRTSASRGFSQSIKSSWTSWETSSMSPDFPCGAWSQWNCWTALPETREEWEPGQWGHSWRRAVPQRSPGFLEMMSAGARQFPQWNLTIEAVTSVSMESHGYVLQGDPFGSGSHLILKLAENCLCGFLDVLWKAQYFRVHWTAYLTLFGVFCLRIYWGSTLY